MWLSDQRPQFFCGIVGQSPRAVRGLVRCIVSELNPSPAVRNPLQLPGDLGKSSRGAQVRSLKLPKHIDARSSPRPWIVGGIVLLLVAGGGYAAVGYLPAQKSLLPAAAAPATAPPKSIVTSATPSAPPIRQVDQAAADTDIALESRGYIIPAHQILVSPEVSGRIIKLSLEEGLRVQAGDTLAELDATDYRNDELRAQAALDLAKHRLAELENGFRTEEIAQAEQELQEAQAQLTMATSQWRRMYELMRSNTAAQEQFEQAESNYNAMQRRVERLRLAYTLLKLGPRSERILAAKAEVQQYEAELAKTRWRLDKCTIRAPISGTILRKNAEEGNLVNPIAFNGSYSICEMADLSDLEVQLDIQERDIARVFKGQPCRVRSEAFSDRSYPGHVSRLMPIADRAKGAVPVRVKV